MLMLFIRFFLKVHPCIDRIDLNYIAGMTTVYLVKMKYFVPWTALTPRSRGWSIRFENNGLETPVFAKRFIIVR